MLMKEITSKDNPHFKQLLELHKKSARDEMGEFIVEGEREVLLAREVEAIFYTEMSPAVVNWVEKGVTAYLISPQLFAKISYRDRGVIAIARKSPKRLQDLMNLSLLLLCEGIEKPGNLGAMMRTADAAGIDGIIITDMVCDLYNPNVIRASLGAFFTVPLAVSTSLDAIAFLEERGVQIVLATPHAEQSYFDVDYTRPTCLVIGSEKEGATQMWEQAAQKKVKIPMQGKVNSLNASISASVLLYEALRQRSTISR